MSIRLPGRDDPVAFAALGVDNGKKLTVDHAGNQKARLAVIHACVEEVECEGVCKDATGRLETNLVLLEVALGFIIILLKKLIVPNIRDTSSFVNCPEASFKYFSVLVFRPL
jgi:hypothetical protein